MLLNAEPTTREGSHPGTLRTPSKMDDYVDAYVAGQRYAQVPLELQFKGAPTGETLRPDAGDFGNASMCIRRQSCSTSYIVTTSGELSSADDDGNCLREDCINVSSRNDGLEAAEHGQDFVVCATRTDGEQESTSRLENNHSTRRRNEDSTAEDQGRDLDCICNGLASSQKLLQVGFRSSIPEWDASGVQDAWIPEG